MFKVIRTVNLAKPKSRGVEGHSPVKYEDIVKNLKDGMTLKEQCEKVNFVPMHGKSVFERAICYKIGQVYTLNSIIKKFKKSRGYFPDSVEDIKTEVLRSGAFNRLESARAIFPLLIKENSHDSSDIL